MTVCRLYSVMAGLLLTSLIVPAQAGSQQPAPAQPAIQVPADLPPPVSEEMRIKGDDIDKVLAEANVILLDVREPWELEKYGAREGYVNIPIGQLEKRLNELRRTRPFSPLEMAVDGPRVPRPC